MPGNSAILCSYMALQEKNPQWSVSIRKTLSTHLFGKHTTFFGLKKHKRIFLYIIRRSLQTHPITVKLGDKELFGHPKISP